MPGPGIASATISVDLDGKRIPAEAAALGREAGALMGKEHGRTYEDELDASMSRVGRKLEQDMKQVGLVSGRSFHDAFAGLIQRDMDSLATDVAEVFHRDNGIDAYREKLFGVDREFGQVSATANRLRDDLSTLLTDGQLTNGTFARLSTQVAQWEIVAKRGEEEAVRMKDSMRDLGEEIRSNLINHLGEMDDHLESVRLEAEAMNRELNQNGLEQFVQHFEEGGHRAGEFGEHLKVLKADFAEQEDYYKRGSAALEGFTQDLEKLPPRLQLARTAFREGKIGFEELAHAAGNGVVDVEKLGNAAEAAGKKFNAPRGYIAIIATLIAALAPAVVALGAGLIGLVAAFGALAGVGVLALLGIKNEMEAGTEVGQKYTAIFSGLTAVLGKLEATAAATVLSGIAKAAGVLSTNFGALNGVVGALGGPLGNLIVDLTNFAVTLITQMTPAFIDGARALSGFVNATNSFVKSSGFTDFLNYLHDILPSVMGLLGSFIGALGGLFSGLAPSSAAFVFALSSVFDLIGALGPVIATFAPTIDLLSFALGGIAVVVKTLLGAFGPFGPALAATALAFVGLSFAAKGLAPALLATADAEGIAAVATRGLGAAVDFALGPVGLVVLALGFLASAIATLPESTGTAVSSVQALTSALQNDNGIIGENVKAMTAQQFASDGVAAAAQRLNLSLKTVTDAATGNAAAAKQVAEATKLSGDQYTYTGRASYQYASTLGKQIADSKTVAEAVKAQSAAIKEATDQYNKVAVATGHAALSYDQISAAAAKVNLKPGDYIAAANAAQQAQSKADALRNSYILAGDAANLLKLDMDALSGKTIASAEAQAAFASGLDGLAASFNKQSKAITGNSNAAIENRGAIAQLVSVAQTSVQAIADQTHSVGQTTSAFKNYRSELINSITAITGNKKAAQQLVDQYLKMPKNVHTDFTGDDRDAKAKAAAAKAAAQDFAKGDYKAALKADPTPANKARAEAMAKALEFAHKEYLAQLKANPTPANISTADAARKAHAFAAADYTAALRANPNSAIRTADGTVQYINGLRATIQVNAVVNSKYAQGLLGNRYGGIMAGGQQIAGGELTAFAAGGILNTPTIFGSVLAGEAGPEAIVPLTGPLSKVDASVRQLSAFARGMSDGFGGPTKVIYVQPTINVPTSDPVAAAGYVVDRLVPQL